MQLPIDLIPGSHPPKFRWSRAVPQIIPCEGNLPATCEKAVAELITLAKGLAEVVAAQVTALEQLRVENEELRKQNQGHCERIASQSDQLGKLAERQGQPQGAGTQVPVARAQQTQPIISPTRKGQK